MLYEVLVGARILIRHINQRKPRTGNVEFKMDAEPSLPFEILCEASGVADHNTSSVTTILSEPRN